MPRKEKEKEVQVAVGDIRELLKLCRTSLMDFVICFLPHHIKSSIPKFHVELYGLVPKVKRLCAVAPRGHAKAESIDSLLLTPSGWKRFGEIKVGDKAIGRDGKETLVTHVHPISKMPLYRVTTRDGRSILCNPEHVWCVQTPSNTGEKIVEKTTEELLSNYKSERYDKRSKKHYVEYRYFLPTVEPIQFSEKEFKVDPYTLGAWLGDGTSLSSGITSNDEELISYIPYKITKNKAKYLYNISGLRPLLREIGVLGNKHIPQEYLFGSMLQRERLLQGLIDTGGSISTDGMQFTFTNKNKRLIEDVISLVRSLGGTCTLGDNYTRFDKNSEYKHSYRITCRVNDSIKPVRLTRKLLLWKGSIKTKSAIVDIRFEKFDYGRCITIANPDGMYVTDDYTLTHNSHIISFFYPLWLAVFGISKDITIISASESLAVEWVRKIRYEIENNKKILAVFGDLKSEKWTESHLILANGVNVRAKGAGSQIRGFRPDTLIIDDLETQESANSEEQRKKNKEWILKDCINTLMPDGQLLMIGTLYNNICVLADFLLSDNGWTKRHYKAYMDGIQEKGHELWPDLWSHERLQARKAEIGTWAFSAEYMNDPMSDENAPVKPEQIRYWEEMPNQYSTVIAVDPAYSEDIKADYKTASLIAIDNQYNRYLMRYIRTHQPTSEFINAIIAMWQLNKNTCSGIGIPNQGVEKSFYQTFVRQCEQKGIFPPVMELKNASSTSTGVSIRNKKQRIIATLQPIFEQGKYYIGKDHHEAREELLQIGSSRWDDIVDTMTYAEQILQPSFFAVSQEPIRYNSSEDDNFYTNNKLEGAYGI